MARKKQGKTTKAIIIYSITFITIYTIACVVGWLIKGIEPPTQLTIGIFSFFGTELCMSMVIKVFKIKKGE